MQPSALPVAHDDADTAAAAPQSRRQLGRIHGREQALQSLETFLADLLDGNGGAILLEGAAGIGKTRLLTEAVARANTLGIVVAEAGADELDQVTPWGPLLKALDASRPRLLSPREIDPLLGQPGTRTAVLARFRATLEEASTKAPILVCIDDLQWADAQTISALTQLVSHLFSYPIGWIFALRPLPRLPALPHLLEQLTEGGAHRLLLRGLDAVAAEAVARDALGPDSGVPVERLVQQSGGNPLFLLELLRAPQSEGTPHSRPPQPTAQSQPQDTPAALRAAVKAHIRSLPAPTIELLKVASVLGRELRTEDLARLTGKSPGDINEAIQDALTAEVLQQRGEHLVFTHDLLRSVLHSSLSQPMRRALHRDAAVALREGGAGPAAVANHFALGASPGDEEAVAAMSEAVGSLYSTSPGTAGDLALSAAKLLQDDDPRQGALVNAAVNLLGWAPRLVEARQVGEDYLKRHHPSADVHAGIELGMRRGWLQHHMVPYPNRLPPHLLDADEVPADVRASLTALNQVEGIWFGDPDEVDRELVRAADLAWSSGDSYGAKAAETLAVLNLQMAGRLSDALLRAQSAAQGALPGTRAMYRMDVVRSLASLGRVGEAKVGLDDAIHAAEEAGLGAISDSLHFLRALLLFFDGRLADAHAEVRNRLAGVDAQTFVTTHGLLLGLLTELSVRRGDLPQARQASGRLTLYATSDEVLAEKLWATSLCHAAGGRLDKAVAAVEPILVQARRERPVFALWRADRIPQIVSLAQQASAERLASDAAETMRDLRRQNPGEPLLEALTEHTFGLLRRDRTALAAAVEGLAACEWPLATARAREDLGASLAADGLRDEAVEQLDAAFTVYTDFTASGDAARVRSALRGIGVRKRQRSSAALPGHGWASLTAAEQAVVRAVAAGRTNREAATELFLSPDTVNTHLRHAFGKLGVRSRLALARAVAMDDSAAV